MCLNSIGAVIIGVSRILFFTNLLILSANLWTSFASILNIKSSSFSSSKFSSSSILSSKNFVNRFIEASLNSIYLKTDAATGKNTYYMTYGGTSTKTLNIEEFFASVGANE